MIGPGVFEDMGQFFDVGLACRTPYQKTCGSRADSTHGKDQAFHGLLSFVRLFLERKMCSGGLDARAGDLVS